MEQTITINLGGLIFHIENDAYVKLKTYIDSIKYLYNDEEEQKEILGDIEARVAELFNERISNKKQAITLVDVDEIIKIMGSPDDFEAEISSEEGGKHIVNRRMYRNPDDRVVGGVCSGMGAYWQIDPILVRVVFVVLTFLSVGVGIFIYLILWIAIPEAKTIAQKLEMKGEPVNIDNIGKLVKDEFNKIKKNMNL